MSQKQSMMWIAAALAAGSVYATDDVPSIGPGSAEHKAMQSRCGGGGQSAQAREQCMRDAEAADEKAGRHCADLTLRARDQCLADAQATAQQQASDKAAGGPQAGASTGGLPTPSTASPGDMKPIPK